MPRPYKLPFSNGPIQRLVSGLLLILGPVALTVFNFYMAERESQLAVTAAFVIGIVLYAGISTAHSFCKKSQLSNNVVVLSVQNEEKIVLLSDS